MLASSHYCFNCDFLRLICTILFLHHSGKRVEWLSCSYNYYFLGHIQILRLREATLSRYIASKTEKYVFFSQHQSVVPTTCYSDNSVIFKSCYSFGLLDWLLISMSELSTVLLGGGASPSVEVSVLVNSGVVILSAINLHCL